jgi:hypothetical protein
VFFIFKNPEFCRDSVALSTKLNLMDRYFCTPAPSENLAYLSFSDSTNVSQLGFVGRSLCANMGAQHLRLQP